MLNSCVHIKDSFIILEDLFVCVSKEDPLNNTMLRHLFLYFRKILEALIFPGCHPNVLLLSCGNPPNSSSSVPCTVAVAKSTPCWCACGVAAGSNSTCPGTQMFSTCCLCIILIVSCRFCHLDDNIRRGSLYSCPKGTLTVVSGLLSIFTRVPFRFSSCLWSFWTGKVLRVHIEFLLYIFLQLFLPLCSHICACGASVCLW